MPTQAPFVVVGAGLAGAKAAETLRGEGFDGPVVLVGAEPERPYERPPLSKQYLLGRADRDSVFVHDAGWYAEHDVDLRTGVRAARLDPAAHRLTLDTGEELAYARLLLATGASPRRLPVPGADLDGVRYLRTLADADRLGTDLAGGGRRVVVVGAGWIGLEVAAAAQSHGNDVTVVEPQPTPLHAVLGAQMGRVFARLHRDHGVELLTDTVVREIRGSGGRVTTVVTDGHAGLPADLVVVGIGAIPNTALAASAGLEVDNGVVTDHALRASAVDVYAAGDVAASFRSTAATSAWSTGPTRCTRARRRRGRCSGRTSCSTGCPTSSPTSTSWAWSTRGSPAPATRSSAAATPTTVRSSPSGPPTAG